MRPRRTTADWITDGRSETMSPARWAPDVSIYYRVARGQDASAGGPPRLPPGSPDGAIAPGGRGGRGGA
jgi:hypothetical protein